MKNLDAHFDVLFPPAIPVVFLHAHPDDESFLSAGIMTELVLRKRRVIIVYAAAASVIGRPKTLVRQVEADKACEVLGIEPPAFLAFCEPKYDDAHASPLSKADVDDIVRELQLALQRKNIGSSFILVSYDVHGGYGNMDHRIVHTAGNIFASRHTDCVLRALEVTLNREAVRSWIHSTKVRLHPDSVPKLSYWSEVFGTEDASIDYCFELSNKQLEQKRLALSAHVSQISPNEFPLSLLPKDFAEFFGKEYLRESSIVVPSVIR